METEPFHMMDIDERDWGNDFALDQWDLAPYALRWARRTSSVSLPDVAAANVAWRKALEDRGTRARRSRQSLPAEDGVELVGNALLFVERSRASDNAAK